MTRPAETLERRRLDYWRGWWELVFYCWRWLIVLIPATAQAVLALVAIFEGRAPALIVDPFR